MGPWLRRLRALATFVHIAALCVAVAVLVIAFIPNSPVVQALPTSSLSGLAGIHGVEPGVVVDRAGTLVFKVSDPSIVQRLIYLATLLPGLFLIAVIARRMAKLLERAQEYDPFTAQTAQELSHVAKVTAFGGVVVWAVGNIAKWGLSATMLTPHSTFHAYQSPLGWLAVGLIFIVFAQLISRGVQMRTELDTVI
jgi:hypothetical protein